MMIKEFVFDVIVLGAGGAGCAAAMAAAKKGASVALISKESIGIGNTRISEATMTSSGILKEDSPEVLKEDMIKGGEYLNNPKLVDLIAQNATSAIRFVESIGHFFRRDEEGRLLVKPIKRLGGHRFARSFVSPGVGVSLARALRNAVANIKLISIFEDVLLISLFKEEEEILGAFALDLKTSDPLVFRGKVTVLATGGCGWLYYPQTTNNRSATGDGYAIAFEAGARLVDMEMVQFFPFSMNHPTHFAGSLLDDPALAGPKGKLMNGLGEVVADHDINRMTRAQVAVLMAKEIAAGRVTQWGGLKLDLSENLDVPEMVHYKKMNDERNKFEKVRIAYGEDAFHWKEPWDISPSAHYMMGGIKIDQDARSSVKNLYAIGEAAGGAMGANRLGSVSIADIFTMGIIAGEEAGEIAAGSGNTMKIGKDLIAEEVRKVESLFTKKGNKRPIKIKKELQQLMREDVGIVRDERRLAHALSEIARMRDDLENNALISEIRRYNTDVLDTIELRNMLTCGELIAHSARSRTESRGAHLRLDYPNKDDAQWSKNIIIWKKNNQFKTLLSDVNTTAV